MTAATVARPARARLVAPPTRFSAAPGACVHGFSYAGAAKEPRPGSACERPCALACNRCGLVVTVDCHSTRTATCEPCGLTYRDRVRRIARVHSGGVLLVTLTAPGRPGHLCNVGGTRVRKLGKDGKRHTVWQGGRWVPCSCWRSALHEHTADCAEDCQVQDFARWNARASALFSRLWNNGVRRADGAEVRTGPNAGEVRDDLTWLHGAYFRATEPQSRGALHFHLLVRVAAHLEVTSADVERLSALAELYGFGHVLDVESVESHRAAGYVAKYVSKGANDRPDVPWHRVKSRRLAADVPPPPEYALRNGWVVEGPRDTWLQWESRRASYRTWTASRDWPLTMRELREAQEHFAALMAVLPSWGEDRPPIPAELAEVAPDVPWLPVPPDLAALVLSLVVAATWR